jgi:hypothetical protein
LQIADSGALWAFADCIAELALDGRMRMYVGIGLTYVYCFSPGGAKNNIHEEEYHAAAG